MTNTTTKIDWTRINNDTNGNPRYVCHFLAFITDQDRSNTDGWGVSQITVLYGIAVKRANKLGGKKFHNKQYGGGIVFQSYNIQDTEKRIYELMENVS